MRRDCPKLREVRLIQLHFPFHETIRAVVTPRSIRDMPHLAQTTLPDMENIEIDGNRFSSNGNCLTIDYSGRSEMVISMQNGMEPHETQIFVTPQRIKIGAKYSILSTELYEDTERESLGYSNSEASPEKAYVLLVAERLFQSTLCLTVNNTRYYLDWRQLTEPSRWAAVFQTSYLYGFRRHVQAPAIDFFLSYFRGIVQSEYNAEQGQSEIPIVVDAATTDTENERTDHQNADNQLNDTMQTDTTDDKNDVALDTDTAHLFDEYFAIQTVARRQSIESIDIHSDESDDNKSPVMDGKQPGQEDKAQKEPMA